MIYVSKRKIMPVLFVFAVLAGVMLPGGCSKKDTARASEPGKELKKFVLPFQTTGLGNPLVAIAYDLKYFEEAGLDVELNPLNTGGNIDHLMAVSTGKIDAALISGMAAPFLFMEQGNDLVIIGGSMGEGGALIARPENVAQYANFTKDSLVGKKIGSVRTITGDIVLREWLYWEGADLSTIDFVELDSPATILEAVRKGEIDVGNIFVLWRYTAEQQGLPVIKHIDELVPNFPCCRISVMKKDLNERRDDYVGFLRSLIRAYKVFTLEHERSLDIIGKYSDADREILQNQYYDYGHYSLSPDPEKKRILESYKGMVDIGYAEGNDVDIPSHIDTSLYKEALDQILAENPDDPFFLEVKAHFEEHN
jgi:NitT/TauT family transport system substrate-binding protein